MLRKFSQEVANCYSHADNCGRRAKAAPTDELRQDFLLLKESWLTLAQSYQFGARLNDFALENRRRQTLRTPSFDKRSEKKATCPISNSSH